MRWFCLSLMSLSLACGPRFRHETLGSSRATAEKTPSAAIHIVDGGDRHIAYLHFSLPRAVKVRYQIECPSQTVLGNIGETWEQYQRRRLAELKRERQRKVAFAGSLVGAVTGHATATATAQAQTPVGDAQATATVDGQAVGAIVAEAVITKAKLPPGDVGAHAYNFSRTLWPKTSGACSLSYWSEISGQDLSGVVADLRIEHLVDIRKEKSAARAVARGGALQVRGKLVATLVAGGADPNRMRDERARLRQAAEDARNVRLRIKWEAKQRARGKRLLKEQAAQRARAERDRKRAPALALQRARTAERRRLERARSAERLRKRQAASAVRRARTAERLRLDRVRRAGALRVLAGARAVRLRVEGVLIGSGCTPYRREQERQQAAARLAMSLRWSRNVRGTLVAQLIRSGADPDYRRKRFEAELQGRAAERVRRERERAVRVAYDQSTVDAALGLRADLKIALVSSGAIDRPARPRAPAVRRPPLPFATAVWVTGHFEWSLTGSQWVWASGYWTQPPSFGLEWLPAVEIVVGGIRVTRPGRWRRPSGGVIAREHD